MKGRKQQLRLTLILAIACILSFSGGLALRRRNSTRTQSGTTTYQAYVPYQAVSATATPTAAAVTAATPTPTSAAASISSSQQVTLASVNGNAETRAKQLVEANKGRSAEIISRIYTIEKGIGLTFQGIGTAEELKNVLNVLTETGSAATFFVTFEDLETNADLIKSIASAGQPVGLAVNTGRYLTTEDLLSAIIAAENTLRTQIGFSGKVCLRQLTGSPSTMLRLAASAGGYTVLSQTRTILTDATATLGTAAQICSSVLGSDMVSRGEILHFELNRSASNTLAGNVVRLIMNNYTTFPALSVNDLLSDLQYQFDYPIASTSILSTVKGKVRAGQLTGETMPVIEKRYIGINWMRGSGYLPGFTNEELSRLDNTGIIKNDRDMVFLTFDGWGDDDRVEELLEVLKTHNVKATFFIRTEDAAKNPALLREIGLAGHSIGSNTHTGFSLANYKSAKTFTDLTSSQVKALREDLVKSYDTLENIVGDLSSGGRPVLTTLFRPYLLAAGRKGLETVFGCGFTYSVSGYFTFEYDEVRNADHFVSTLSQKIKSGQIYIFHLDDMPEFMPGAIDSYLTKMEGQKKQYRFVSLAEVL